MFFAKYLPLKDQFNFTSFNRSGQILNVCGEKVDQAVVSSVMTDMLQQLGTDRMVDYACAESNLLLQGIVHYVPFCIKIRECF